MTETVSYHKTTQLTARYKPDELVLNIYTPELAEALDAMTSGARLIKTGENEYTLRGPQVKEPKPEVEAPAVEVPAIESTDELEAMFTEIEPRIAAEIKDEIRIKKPEKATRPRSHKQNIEQIETELAGTGRQTIGSK